MSPQSTPEVSSSFPHLLPVERKLWVRFLSSHPGLFDRFDYDVHIGAGVMPSAKPGDPYARNFRDLTQKRIDVIGWEGSEPTIIEIRERADLGVIGKLVAYGKLWERENPLLPEPFLMLVCASIGPDDRFVATRSKVEIYVV